MKINREGFVSILLLVNPGLANKATVEQSDCFIFQNKRVFTCNDEIAISHPIELNVEGAVNGKKLLEILKKSSDEEVDIFLEGGHFRVHGKKSRVGIKVDEDIKLPFTEAGWNATEWEILPEDFCSALKFCMFSASRDASRPLLTCVHVNGDVVESCDNFRLTRIKLSKTLDEYLIPAEAAKVLSEYNPEKVAKVGGWLYFLNKHDVLFCCRTYNEEYPNLAPIMHGIKGEEARWPEGVTDALCRAEVFGESSLKSVGTRVAVTLSDGRMTVRGEGDHGFFEEDMRVKFTGEVEFEINAEFFAEILKHTNKATIGNGKLKFEDKNWVHVVSLLKK